MAGNKRYNRGINLSHQFSSELVGGIHLSNLQLLIRLMGGMNERELSKYMLSCMNE